MVQNRKYVEEKRRTSGMKIAVTYDDGNIFQHFGKWNYSAPL